MKFVDIKNDIAFRKIFGNENKKIILLSFLNAILDLQGSRRIEHVEILNPYQLPIIRNLKASIIDVKARDAQGKTYIVEMQVSEPEGLDKRLLYYVSKEYSQQIESGEKYIDLNPVIFIGIFDFPFTQGESYLSHHAVCDVETSERVMQDIDFYLIELPKFHKTLAELISITDKWIYFIKESENLEVIPEHVEDEGLRTAYLDANKYNWTREELEAYDYFAMREQDERGKLSAAEKKGERRGKKEGKIEGKLEVAGNLKRMGLSVEEIQRATGLDPDEISSL